MNNLDDILKDFTKRVEYYKFASKYMFEYADIENVFSKDFEKPDVFTEIIAEGIPTISTPREAGFLLQGIVIGMAGTFDLLKDHIEVKDE